MFSLQRAILETVAYADALNRPLTPFEIWRNLLDSNDSSHVDWVSLVEILVALDSSFLRKRLAFADGFIFLRGREVALLSRRTCREKFSDRQIMRAQKVARILRYVPFVRMVAITGSLSAKSSDRESDWDFFIILAAGRIWTGRALVAGVLHILGLRRHGKHVANRACLNYWITDDALEISEHDIFGSGEYSSLIPLFGDSTFRKFEEANMAWIPYFRPLFAPSKARHLLSVSDTRFSRTIRTSLERICPAYFLEDKLRNVQRAKILSNPKTKWLGSRIEATDTALVFLPRPAAPRVLDTFRRRLADVEAGVK